MSGISVSVNASAVIAELGKIDKHAFKAVVSIVEESAIDVRDEWKANAKESSGRHGSWYAHSIRYRMVPAFTSIVADIEPTPGYKQAGMSFEFGSRNQPPHLDGQRAIDRYAPLIARRIQAAMSF